MHHKLALIVLCCACGAGSPLVLGTDDGGFQPLSGGGVVKAYMGRQGGFHVWLAVRASGIDPGDPSEPPTACSVEGDFANPCVDFVVTDVGSGRVLDVYTALRLPFAAAGNAFESVPSRLVQLDIRSLSEVDGRILRIDATVTDRHGVRLTASVDETCVAVRPAPDAGP